MHSGGLGQRAIALGASSDEEGISLQELEAITSGWPLAIAAVIEARVLHNAFGMDCADCGALNSQSVHLGNFSMG